MFFLQHGWLRLICNSKISLAGQPRQLDYGNVGIYRWLMDVWELSQFGMLKKLNSALDIKHMIHPFISVQKHTACFGSIQEQGFFE